MGPALSMYTIYTRMLPPYPLFIFSPRPPHSQHLPVSSMPEAPPPFDQLPPLLLSLTTSHGAHLGLLFASAITSDTLSIRVLVRCPAPIHDILRITHWSDARRHTRAWPLVVRYTCPAS